MMLSQRLPLTSLIPFCRAIRHQMESGLTLSQIMKHQAKRGPLRVRPVARRMADRMERGDDFKQILEDERALFPPLFLALSGVAEDTGKLPEVLGDLEDYFELQVTLRRNFITQITPSLIQFCLAIAVLTFLIWILGVIEGTRGPSPISVFGLKGGDDALYFLACVIGGIALIGGGYWLIKAVLKMGAPVDSFLLAIPVIGPCLRAFALSRFSMGMSLSMEAGMPIADAAKLSFTATNNAAFEALSPRVQQFIKEGETLAHSLDSARIFPEEYVAIVDTAEISGNEPEVFQRQAKHYNEEAGRRLKRLATAAGWGVWVIVAIFIISFIMQLAMSYIGMIDAAASGRF